MKKLFIILLSFIFAFGACNNPVKAATGNAAVTEDVKVMASNKSKKTKKTTAKKKTAKLTSKKKWKKVVTITPSSKPCSKAYRGSTYKKVSKNTYTMRSYMARFEKMGGGTLILKRGTYYLNNTVYVPSNVKIIFEDGVVLKKTFKRYKGKVKKKKVTYEPSLSMFMLCTPSIAYKSAKYKPGKYNKAYKKYNGVHDIQFIAKGDCVIDLKNVERKVKPLGAIAIEMGHNRNVTISGITFKNCYNGHFIELDAGKNIHIKDCEFKNLSDRDGFREAINIDNPEIKGFYITWSSLDKTGNRDVYIDGCTFKNVVSGIGDHNITKGYPHKNINVSNCIFDNCAKYGIRANNWENATIGSCTFTNFAYNTKKSYAKPIAGIRINKLMVDNCLFENTACVLLAGRMSYLKTDYISANNVYDNVFDPEIHVNGDVWEYDAETNAYITKEEYDALAANDDTDDQGADEDDADSADGDAANVQ